MQNSRARRIVELTSLVDDARATLESGTARVALSPMSSYERKIVHDLAAERGMDSESDGQGRQRHVVLSLAEGH